MALNCLNQITRKDPSPTGHGITDAVCARCGTQAPATHIHTAQTCPCNTHISNQLDTELDALTLITHDSEDLQRHGPLPVNQGPSPSSLLTIVEGNRRALSKATLEGPLKPLPTGLTSRTTRLPIPYQTRDHTPLDNLIDMGQIALLYTLSAHKLPAGAEPPPPLPSAPPPQAHARAGVLCSPYHCFDCGGIGVTNESCPLHRTCYRHRQTNPQGIPACRHCPVAASAAPAIGLLPLRDLLYRLLINTAKTPPPPPSSKCAPGVPARSQNPQRLPLRPTHGTVPLGSCMARH